MVKLARIFQLTGLIIPPLAMAAQLSENISTGKMLQFLLLSVGLFVLGYVLQQYRG